MNKYRATFKLKPYLIPHLAPVETQEVEACTILEAIAIVLTENEFVDIPEIIKIELVDKDTAS